MGQAPEENKYMFLIFCVWFARNSTVILIIINPRRACAARVTVYSRSVSTCLSVYDYSRTTGYEAAYERYQQL